jgi:hypothetical protein
MTLAERNNPVDDEFQMAIGTKILLRYRMLINVDIHTANRLLADSRMPNYQLLLGYDPDKMRSSHMSPASYTFKTMSPDNGHKTNTTFPLG